MSIGILLANLGTPDAPTPKAVRRFLKEFLWDARVVDRPRFLWWIILHSAILTTRPRRVAKLYQSIWQSSGAGTGSPLLAISIAQRDALQKRISENRSPSVHIELGMRYGSPSIVTALKSLQTKGCSRILVFPLYPQYSSAGTASIVDAVMREFTTWRDVPELRTIHHYFDHPAYIAALAASIREYWHAHGAPEKLLISFHGYPQRYVDLGDPYFDHCKRSADLLSQALGLGSEQWMMTFQSQFGREAWLRPSTVETLQALPRRGTRRVHVVCPGFSADCLETLQENAIENKRFFIAAGGADFHYIPALNASPDHIEALAALVEAHTRGWQKIY